jgi:hypothetical protein
LVLQPARDRSTDFDTYVRAYKHPGAVRGAMSDYRANAEDINQDLADADTKIACPTMAIWGEDFYAVGGMFDMKEVWEGMATHLRARSPLHSAGIYRKKSGQNGSTPYCLIFWTPGKVEMNRPRPSLGY